MSRAPLTIRTRTRRAETSCCKDWHWARRSWSSDWSTGFFSKVSIIERGIEYYFAGFARGGVWLGALSLAASRIGSMSLFFLLYSKASLAREFTKARLL